jgi:hypothetical protein
MTTSELNFLKSLGFGAMLGAGLGGILFCGYYNKPSSSITLKEAMMIGGLLGGAIHRLLDQYIITPIISPLIPDFAFYRQLLELRMLQRRGLLEEQKADELLNGIIEKKFLGKPMLPSKTKKEKQLPTLRLEDKSLPSKTSTATEDNPSAPFEEEKAVRTPPKIMA